MSNPRVSNPLTTSAIHTALTLKGKLSGDQIVWQEGTFWMDDAMQALFPDSLPISSLLPPGMQDAVLLPLTSTKSDAIRCCRGSFERCVVVIDEPCKSWPEQCAPFCDVCGFADYICSCPNACSM